MPTMAADCPRIIMRWQLEDSKLGIQAGCILQSHNDTRSSRPCCAACLRRGMGSTAMHDMCVQHSRKLEINILQAPLGRNP
jgi:hypothetical protein